MDIIASHTRLCVALSCLLDVVREPIKTFVETVTRSSAGRLDVPGTLSQAVKPELIRHLCRVHGIGKILLVGKDKKDGIPQLVFIKHALELFPCLDNTITIVGVDDKDDTLGILKVMSPEWADLVLATDIPDGKSNVLILDRLDIKANGRDGGHNFTELELVENGCLSSGVETNHKNSHLLFTKQPLENFRKIETHGDSIALFRT